MARRGYNVKRALPLRDCTAIEERVEALTKNMVANSNTIGFTSGEDLERILYHEHDLPRVRDAFGYFSHITAKRHELNIKDFVVGTRVWNITINTNTNNPEYRRHHEVLGYISAHRDRVQRLKHDEMPEGLRAIIADHVVQRYRAGIEVGMTRKIVKDVLDRLSSPMQVQKIWPELLQYAAGGSEKLDDKAYKLRQRATTRIVMPQFWNERASPAKDGTPMTRGQRYEAAIRMATLTLAKCSMLGDADHAAGLYKTRVELVNAVPLTAPWDDRAIPIV